MYLQLTFSLQSLHQILALKSSPGNPFPQWQVFREEEPLRMIGFLSASFHHLFPVGICSVVKSLGSTPASTVFLCHVTSFVIHFHVSPSGFFHRFYHNMFTSLQSLFSTGTSSPDIFSFLHQCIFQHLAYYLVHSRLHKFLQNKSFNYLSIESGSETIFSQTCTFFIANQSQSTIGFCKE